MTNIRAKKKTASEECHIVLEQINFELQKLSNAITCLQKTLISSAIVRLSKNEGLSKERLAEIINSYDELLLRLLDGDFKEKHKVVLKEVMDNIFRIVGEYNQKLITAAISAEKLQ